jgi:hypothetical protein
MKKVFIAMAMIGSVSFLVSCEGNDVTAPVVLGTKTVNDLQADTILGIYTSGPATGQPYGSGKFTFYSLERNEVVPNSDSATNKWDLGFRGTTVITNSGSSGPGNGGAYMYVGTFAEVSQVSADSTFRVDNGSSSLAIRSGSGNGWYSYNGATQIVTPIPGRVFLVRTATGKYAKVEILNYYKGGVTLPATATDEEKLKKQRYYTFRFTYQPNGSTRF